MISGLCLVSQNVSFRAHCRQDKSPCFAGDMTNCKMTNTVSVFVTIGRVGEGQSWGCTWSG